MIQIVTGDQRPVFRQIVDGIRMQVATGELPPGSRLPSVRGLASQLTINSNTVAKAYAELTTEGVIESRRGVGVFVCEPRQLLSDGERERRLESAVERFVRDTVSLGYEPDELVARLVEELSTLAREARR